MGQNQSQRLKKQLNVGPVAILPQLKKLRENSLILKTGDVYSLSPLGIAVAGRMQAMVDVLNVFGSKYDYWANHAVECIPAPLRKRIGELANCTFSEPPDRTRLFEPHREFVENLMNIKKNKWHCLYFSPSLSISFPDFCKKGSGYFYSCNSPGL